MTLETAPSVPDIIHSSEAQSAETDIISAVEPSPALPYGATRMAVFPRMSQVVFEPYDTEALKPTSIPSSDLPKPRNLGDDIKSKAAEIRDLLKSPFGTSEDLDKLRKDMGILMVEAIDYGITDYGIRRFAKEEPRFQVHRTK